MHRKGLKIILRDLDKHPLISALAALKARTSEIIESFEKIDELDQDVRAQMRRHRRALDTDGMASHLAGVQQKRSQGLKREAYDLIVSLTTDAVNLEGTLARAYELPYVPFTPPDTERMDYGVRRAEHGGKLVVDYLKEISAGCLSAAMVLYDQLGPDLPPTTPLGGGR